MIRLLVVFALSGFALAGVSAAGELPPGSGHSIHLAGIDGTVYYTVEQDGYRVVATLASSTHTLPIRLTSTLGRGQHIVISVAQSVDQPSIDFEIQRNGDALVIKDPIAAATGDLLDDVPNPKIAYLPQAQVPRLPNSAVEQRNEAEQRLKTNQQQRSGGTRGGAFSTADTAPQGHTLGRGGKPMGIW
jgi:hypothetical protein